MTIATQLYEKAFHKTRDPRSEAYKAGVLDTLNFKESGSELKHPFAPGTAESDAWFAGNQEGYNIWRDREQATTNHACVNDHYTNLGLASGKFIECQTLFEAIITSAESDQLESLSLSQADGLAEIGRDISSYWCEHFDAQREEVLKIEEAEFIGGAK